MTSDPTDDPLYRTAVAERDRLRARLAELEQRLRPPLRTSESDMESAIGDRLQLRAQAAQERRDEYAGGFKPNLAYEQAIAVLAGGGDPDEIAEYHAAYAHDYAYNRYKQERADAIRVGAFSPKEISK